MLKKAYKFSKSDFALIKTKTVHRESTVFGLLYILEPGFYKNVIVVPKKVYKKAHDRNYIKRVFYDWVRVNHPPAPSLQRGGMAVFLKKQVDSLQLTAELGRIIDTYYKKTH